MEPNKPMNSADIKTTERRNRLISATIEDAQRLQSFALMLEGDALAPDFEDGDLLTIGVGVMPVPGDCIVALIQGQYGCMRLNADGDLWDNNGGFIARGFYEVAGVVLNRTPRAPKEIQEHQ